jgi:hypothetical protein
VVTGGLPAVEGAGGAGAELPGLASVVLRLVVEADAVAAPDSRVPTPDSRARDPESVVPTFESRPSTLLGTP